MIRVLRFNLLLLFVLVPFLCMAADSQFSYTLPPNISLKFADKADNGKDRIQLTAMLESLLGNLTELEIFFDCSKDLKVVTSTRSLKQLLPGQKRKVKILAVKTGNKAGELGSWIKMGVRYRPDYARLKEVSENQQTYPDRFERLRLQEIVARNTAQNARYLEAIRWFPSK